MSAKRQKSVARWADKTFGRTTPGFAADRAINEMKEFRRAVKHLNFDDVIKEAADVTICFLRLAETMGRDLMKEVDRKMAVNRRRKWILDGKGGGRHVKSL